ncbi:four helix bundle protein [Flaviaesturariibacter amylovorans]|uniref:Four helix bundle protein n=1 Tax=Flaviaesturariibacter amylovorans TaxID=1084520 RepID=A0ABP8HAJ7_9BACT
MNFEDLYLLEDGEKPYNIRHRAFHFSKDLVLFIKGASYDRIFISMFDQLLRSGTSIGANLVEGRAGSSKKDWRNYYAIALKSANETKYWLCLIRDTLDQDKVRLNELLKEADELSKIIASIIISE